MSGHRVQRRNGAQVSEIETLFDIRRGGEPRFEPLGQSDRTDPGGQRENGARQQVQGDIRRAWLGWRRRPRNHLGVGLRQADLRAGFLISRKVVLVEGPRGLGDAFKLTQTHARAVVRGEFALGGADAGADRGRPTCRDLRLGFEI